MYAIDRMMSNIHPLTTLTFKSLGENFRSIRCGSILKISDTLGSCRNGAGESIGRMNSLSDGATSYNNGSTGSRK